jgi:Uma2 family endonuclease
MATATLASEQRVLIHGVDWHTYSRLLRAFRSCPGVRLTYDRGALEIMSPLFEHEVGADLLARFVVVLTEEMGLPIEAGGSVTLRRRRRRRGLEPDRCWWIANADVMRGKQRLDLRTDPPPDLGVEIDVTSSSLNRLRIYAAIKVPEIWRFDGLTLEFLALGPDGRYARRDHSLAFVWITPADLLRFMALKSKMDQNAVVREFRNWVRQQIQRRADSEGGH